MKNKKKSITSKGYKELRKVQKRAKSYRNQRNCVTCRYAIEDEALNIICNNNGVLPYDLVEEDNLTYCGYWLPYWYENEDFE